MKMSFKIQLLFVCCCCFSAGTFVSSGQQPDFTKTEVFTEGFPRAFFFRYSEGLTHVGYEDWNNTFDRLGGIMGKCLNEEIPGRASNIPYFSKFKQEHPEQLVMLHYNGNGRDPRDNADKFHASHWLYYEGTKLLENLTAQEGLITIKVQDPSIFKMNIGRYKSRNEDIGMCRLTKDGKPDWNYAEQLELLDVDLKAKTITVKRACFGTEALVFRAGETLLSPHVTEGPWGKNNNLLWLYNHSTKCPKDADGNTCNTILSEEFGQKFSGNGELKYFDGVEFDVLWNEISHPTFGRKVDSDCDGQGDSGVFNGVDEYSIGVFQFCGQLREAIGSDKLILADGMSSQFQRGTGYLNGIESEGWPIHRDPEVNDWSGGWNRHLFWNQNAFQPAFSYVNFKYLQNLEVLPPVSRQRLIWATTMLMDARITHSGYRIQKPVDGIYTEIIDELVAGKRDRKYWLGQPLEPATRIALTQPNILKAQGFDLIEMINGDDVKVEDDGSVIKVSKSSKGDLKFDMSGIECDGSDLVVSMKIKCDSRAGYPDKMPRLLNVNIKGSDLKLMSYVNDDWFLATFYFRDIEGKTVDLQFEMESNESLWIKDITAHAYPDVVYRRFENGIVISNPAHHEIEFDLKKIADGVQYYHLNGTQDKKVNNGKKAKDIIVLSEREGLFLETRGE